MEADELFSGVRFDAHGVTLLQRYRLVRLPRVGQRCGKL